MPKNNTFFSKNLVLWYLHNKRELPWRSTKDPYRIWLSEIMLQQTRVAQGLPYYLSFTATFPTVHDLAAASEEQVLKLWQGLGYYSRARNLHTTAKYVSGELGGTFPNNFEDLLQLKGVGDYTASAIASICYNAPNAVVDGNVYRVLSRYFGIDTPINSTPGIKEFKKLAQLLIDSKQPGTYNQAVMEFGARYCIPQNPDCHNCIFRDPCVAFGKDRVKELPVKLKKTKVQDRFYNFMVVLSEDECTLLNQRTGKGIWQNLYEFPLIESSSEVSLDQLKALPAFKEFEEKLPSASISKFNDTVIVHKLSHRNLRTTFWIVETEALGETGIPVSEIHDYPVPVLIEKFMTQFEPMKCT